MHGKSLTPLLRGKNVSNWRDAIYYHYQMNDGAGKASHVVAKHYGVRTDRYKLMYMYTHDYWELYDLKKDRDEMTNLINNPEYAQIAAGLKTRLGELRSKFADTTGKDAAVE
jgi:hypothetical protein